MVDRPWRSSYLGSPFVERLWRSVKHEEVSLKAYESVAKARAGIGSLPEESTTTRGLTRPSTIELRPMCSRKDGVRTKSLR